MVLLLLIIGGLAVVAGIFTTIISINDNEAVLAVAGIVFAVLGIVVMLGGQHMDDLEHKINTRTTDCGSVRVIAPQNYEITCNNFHPIPH